MFKLTIHDRKGTLLNEGDILRVWSFDRGATYTFYAEVKYLPEENIIAPFHTFSFHSFEKVDKLPETAVLSELETRYKTWTCYEESSNVSGDEFKNYLMEWRTCETLLEEKIFRIERINQTTLF